MDRLCRGLKQASCAAPMIFCYDPDRPTALGRWDTSQPAMLGSGKKGAVKHEALSVLALAAFGTGVGRFLLAERRGVTLWQGMRKAWGQSRGNRPPARLPRCPRAVRHRGSGRAPRPDLAGGGAMPKACVVSDRERHRD